MHNAKYSNHFKLITKAAVHFKWAIGIVVAIIVVSYLSLISTGLKINNTSISNLQTYRLTNATSSERIAQSTFQLGDPIQIGLSYANPTDPQAEPALVQFVVVSKQNGTPLFTTTMFQLDPNNKTLFVSINNTNLPADSYTVQLRDSHDHVISQYGYEIKS